MSIVFLFIDGIGLGEAGPSNPFSNNNYSSFETLAGGRQLTNRAEVVEKEQVLFRPIDARLDVEGLPQSGTGQVTLFSGENAAKVIGKHFGPFPHSQTRYLLEQYSLFQKVQKIGREPYFMNAYPKRFFQFLNKRNRWTSTTLMTKSAGLGLNTIEEVKAETAVTAELTQGAWKNRLGLDVPEIKPEEAARRVHNMLGSKDLILLEYYLTDKAGHSQNPEMAGEVLTVLDRFVGKLTDLLAPERDESLVITSDHGNLEDLSTKTHTLNSVPLMVNGTATSAFKGVQSIMGVTDAILKALDSE